MTRKQLELSFPIKVLNIDGSQELSIFAEVKDLTDDKLNTILQIKNKISKYKKSKYKYRKIARRRISKK